MDYHEDDEPARYIRGDYDPRHPWDSGWREIVIAILIGVVVMFTVARCTPAVAETVWQTIATETCVDDPMPIVDDVFPNGGWSVILIGRIGEPMVSEYRGANRLLQIRWRADLKCIDAWRAMQGA